MATSRFSVFTTIRLIQQSQKRIFQLNIEFNVYDFILKEITPHKKALYDTIKSMQQSDLVAATIRNAFNQPIDDAIAKWQAQHGNPSINFTEIKESVFQYFIREAAFFFPKQDTHSNEEKEASAVVTITSKPSHLAPVAIEKISPLYDNPLLK